MRDFVRPAELFEEEVTKSLCRILSETDSIGMRKLVHSYAKKVSIVPPVVTNEVYLIFDKNDEQRKRLFDFALAKTFSYTIHDWYVDRDLTDRTAESLIAVKWLDELGSSRLGECSQQALKHYAPCAYSYLSSMMDELELEPTEQNYFKRLQKTSKMYGGMFGAAAMVGGASRKELSHICSFGENFCEISKLIDDIKDYDRGEKWNIANMLGKEAIEDMQASRRENAINHIISTRPSKHAEYLIELVRHLYQ